MCQNSCYEIFEIFLVLGKGSVVAGALVKHLFTHV